METKLIIIGAGTAGLTAGCYAAMNGYTTTILEMNVTPGGLCTSWRRGGFLFDGSVAGLAGSAPGSPLYKLWSDIGVTTYCPLHYGESFGSIRLLDGRTVTIYTDVNRLEAHLMEYFPAEEACIRAFTHAIRSVLNMDIPFSDARGWAAVKEKGKAFLSSMKLLPALMKYGRLTIRQFAGTVKDPALQTVFHNLVHFGGLDVPLLTVLLPLAYAHRKMAGIPERGWLSFARAIERRFVELGGSTRYKSKVAQLIVENGAVKGVLLENGTRIMADRVLSAADGRFSTSLLLGKTQADTQWDYQPQDVSDQPVQVNLGVDMDFSNQHGPMTYIMKESMMAAGREHERITVHNKYYDKDAAHAGKSALTVFIDSDYGWWKNIADDTVRYDEEKKRCLDMVVAILDKHHPGIRDKVVVSDVSTPVTRERYTGNWMGAMQARKPNKSMIKSLLQGKPQYAYRGIEGLYMAGQWVEAWGGITTAAQSGRNAIKAMCKKDGKTFAATR